MKCSLRIFLYIADFSETDKSEMYDILGGKIKFYPRYEVQEETSFKAPNLKDEKKGSTLNAAQRTVDRMHIDSGVKEELKDMVKAIRRFSVLEQEG